MTVLTVVQKAWERLGIEDDVPSAVMSSADTTVRILRSLLAEEGQELAGRGPWQRLVKEQSFSTTAATVQVGAIPADFARLIDGTLWNYTEREPLLGPLSPAEWQDLSAGLVGPPDLYYRLRGNDMLIIPDPPAGQTIKFEYVSLWWVDTDSDGAGEADAPVSDTDTFLLRENLLTLGLMWRWLKRNRMPYEDYRAEYEVQVSQELARDGTKGTLSMGGRRVGSSARYPGVPDGSWNLP